MKSQVQILVVDDEPTVRAAIKQLLQHIGFEVEAVDGGEAALARLSQRPFNVVITDFSMPGMAGDQLVARIRQRTPEQAIIMVTAFAEEYKSFGRHASVNALVLKPFTLKELNGAIQQVLAQAPHQSQAALMAPATELPAFQAV